MLPLDGQSQSLLTIVARDSNGTPIGGGKPKPEPLESLTPKIN